MGRIITSFVALSMLVGLAGCQRHQSEMILGACDYLAAPEIYQKQKLKFMGTIELDDVGNPVLSYDCQGPRRFPIVWEAGAKPPPDDWLHVRLAADGRTPLPPLPPSLDFGTIVGVIVAAPGTRTGWLIRTYGYRKWGPRID